MSDSDHVSDIPGKCPTPIELGNSGWNILHSAAAVYPYKPTAAQREAMNNFIHSWSYVYACNWCAYHMRQYLKEHEPDVTDKLTVTRFICEFHNEVNENLGKELYDCDPDKVLKRWHPGYPDKMVDTPSMEDRIAAELQKKAAAEEEGRRKAAEVERRLSNFGKPSGNSPRGETEWRSWNNTRTTDGATAAAPEGAQHAAAATAQNDSQQKRWWFFGGVSAFGNKGECSSRLGDMTSRSQPSTSSPASSSGTTTVPPPAAVKPKKPADDETDVDEVLRRLRGCQVYCPEDE